MRIAKSGHESQKSIYNFVDAALAVVGKVVLGRLNNFIHLNPQFCIIVAQELLIYYITVGNMKREYTV